MKELIRKNEWIVSSLPYHTESHSWFWWMGKIQAANCNILSGIASCLGTCHANVYFLWFKLSHVQAAAKSETNTMFYYLVPIFFQVLFVCGFFVCFWFCFIFLLLFSGGCRWGEVWDFFQATHPSQMTWANEASQDLALDIFHQFRVL